MRAKAKLVDSSHWTKSIVYGEKALLSPLASQYDESASLPFSSDVRKDEQLE